MFARGKSGIRTRASRCDAISGAVAAPISRISFFPNRLTANFLFHDKFGTFVVFLEAGWNLRWRDVNRFRGYRLRNFREISRILMYRKIRNLFLFSRIWERNYFSSFPIWCKFLSLPLFVFSLLLPNFEDLDVSKRVRNLFLFSRNLGKELFFKLSNLV